MGKLVTVSIESIVPYNPGKTTEELKSELGLEKIIRACANETFLPPSEKAIEAVVANLDQLPIYPDGGASNLRNKIAQKMNVDADEVVLGNGSNELIELIVRTFARPADEIITSIPSFVVYKHIALAHGLKVHELPLKNQKFDLAAMKAKITPQSRFIFIANPNNPTGTYITNRELEEFLTDLPEDLIVVLDEAYIEYVDADDFPNSLDYRNQHQNLITLRTFSKIYGLAALRVGYAIAQKNIINYLGRVRAVFNVNSLAQVAAEAVLDDREYIQNSKNLLLQNRKQLSEGLSSLGLTITPSQANFVLVDLMGADTLETQKELLKRGVFVAPMPTSWLPHHHRVSVCSFEDNMEIISAYKEVLKL
ncbi:MAG: histidinol-phosphate transaminase [Bacteriovoracaceae bacterium]|jgi:histidinol-phosphate aminotransferase|nr:histidinol-phosphate transaminase [Bacteriovoracaceae bacterium]